MEFAGFVVERVVLIIFAHMISIDLIVLIAHTEINFVNTKSNDIAVSSVKVHLSVNMKR